MVISAQNNVMVEVHLKDGQIKYFDEIGRSPNMDGQMMKTFLADAGKGRFHLHMDKLSEVTFKEKTEKSIVADVLLISGAQKTFELQPGILFCKKGDDGTYLDIMDLKKIYFIKLN
jgi:hypothetical protein